MHTLSIGRLLALTTLTVALAACGDSTGSESSRRGDLEFSYSGAASGQFDASGEFRQSNRLFEFAAAFVDEDGLQLLALEEAGNDRGNLFVLVAPEAEQTTTCTQSTDPFDCRIFGGLVTGVTEGSEDYDRSFSSFEGSVTVTEISESRVRGTFSFTMEDDDNFDAPVLQVRSGTFNVPIIAQGGGSLSSVRATAARLNAGRQGSARP